MSALLEMQTFLEIVGRGSLSAAARSLGAVPSTISARLTALEGRLGVRLLTRSTRQLRLTEEGERYLVDCRRILDEVERSEACLGRWKGSLRGGLRVTAPSDLGRGRLRRVLDAFVEAHPRVALHLHLSDEVVDLVRGGYDLALRVGRPPDSSLVARKLARGRRVVCAAPGYWAARPRPSTPLELVGHECLLWNADGRNEATWSFASAGGPGEPQAIRVRGRRSSNDGELVRAWALAGLGVAQKSLWDVERDLDAGRLETALDGFVLPANLYVVYPGGGPLPRRVRCLVDHLVKEAPCFALLAVLFTAAIVVTLAGCGPSAGSTAPPSGRSEGAPSAQGPASARPSEPKAAPAGVASAAGAAGASDAAGVAGASGAAGDATTTAPPGGEACASSIDDAALASALKAVGEALVRRDMASLAGVAHPSKGVRFSPYAYVTKASDVVLKPRELRAAMSESKLRTWGSYDGSGDPIRLTFRGYFDKFIYDRDFVRTGQYARGRTLQTGNTKSNLCEEYPGAAFVEYHVPAADPQGAGPTWASLRLVFEATPVGLRLVGIVHDQWTI